MLQFRLHPRLRSRVDPSDVLQEAYIEASRRLADYLRHPEVPLFLWLRRIVGHALWRTHRRHLDTKMRDAGREIHLGSHTPEATSASMAHQFVSDRTSPSGAAVRAETKAAVERALEDLNPRDREILALRFFERLSNAEAAQSLGIDEEAGRKRYFRALQRFKKAFGEPLESENG